MSYHAHILPALAAALTAASAPAFGLSITSETTVYAAHSRVTSLTVDETTEPWPTVLSAEVVPSIAEVWNADMTGPGLARADAGPLTSSIGYSNVYLEGLGNDSTHPHAQTLSAGVTQRWEVTPTDPSTMYPVYYSFEIFNMFAEIWDGGGLDWLAGESVGARFRYEISLDGRTVFSYVAGATTTPDPDLLDPYARVADAQAGTVGSVGFAQMPGAGGESLKVVFDDFALTDLFLGFVQPDGDTTPESFFVEARLAADLELPRFVLDAGGIVNIGDPNSPALGTRASITVGPPGGAGVIPLPGSLWLAASGLALVALGARRRR